MSKLAATRGNSLALPLLVGTLALVAAGCGGHPAGRPAMRTVTVATYAGFPATTIVGTYSASACAADARSYVREALLFVAHSGPQAAYSADNYYLLLRQIFADFQARSCGNETLGVAIKARMTAHQRAALVRALPAAMAEAVREGLNGG